MKLAEFCAYLGEQWRAVQQVYAEIEEVQYQFNAIYYQTLEAWKAAAAKAVPMLMADAALPPRLAQSLLEVTDEERAKLAKEIADLTGKVQQQRREADSAVAEGQAELTALRQVNPQLDAEEEQIKAGCASTRQAIRRLEAEIKTTGLLNGFFERRRLRRKLGEQRRALAEGITRLRRVRQAWEDEGKRFEANQSRLHQKWETASVEAAQLQARLDYLQTNLLRLSQENGASRFVAELQDTPDAPEPLHGALGEIASLNRVKREYEDGLRAVAETLGLLKGLAEGMERFLKSADKVLEEQRQYNLSELWVKLSDAVLDFHALWPAFRAEMKDEKALGRHPIEFSRRVHTIIENRLTDNAIDSTFESMGEALTEATKAWG